MPSGLTLAGTLDLGLSDTSGTSPTRTYQLALSLRYDTPIPAPSAVGGFQRVTSVVGVGATG